VQADVRSACRNELNEIQVSYLLYLVSTKGRSAIPLRGCVPAEAAGWLVD
jgi:hypothetical protein